MHLKHRTVSWIVVTCMVVAWLSADITAKIVGEEIAATHGNADARKELEMNYVKILKDNASLKQKDHACRVLRVIGTVDAVPALAGMLADKKLSHIARYALEPMPYPEVGQALRNALGRAKGTAKIGVIHSLGVRKDREAVDLLVPLLKDTDDQIAAAAAFALGRAGTLKAARVLIGFCDDAPAGLRAAVLDASLTAAEQLLIQGKRNEAAKIYEDIQTSTAKVPDYVRMGAFAGLLTARPDEAVSKIIKAIADKDATLSGTAIAHIATLKGRGVTRRFAAELPGLPAEAQVLLIRVLVRRGDLAASPAITTAVTSPNSEVRMAAVEALGEIGDASSVKLLVRAISDGKSHREKQVAVVSLLRLSGDGIDETIVSCMKTSSVPATRAKLIEVLQDRHVVAVVPDLLNEAAGPDKDVRKAAFKAIAVLATPEHLPGIIKLLVNLKGDEGRKEAERAVVMVSRKLDDKARHADAILAAFGRAGGTATKCSLLRTLQGVGDAKAFKEICAALKDKESAVQDTAVRVLADWPDARATDTLLEVFQTTDNKTHRVVAMRGCTRLLGLGGYSAQKTLRVCGELMDGTRRPEERKLVLACLANAADPAALKLVEPYLTDNEVKAEAELAMLGIARAIIGSARDEARAAANKLLEKSANDTVRKEAAAIIQEIDKIKN